MPTLKLHGSRNLAHHAQAQGIDLAAVIGLALAVRIVFCFLVYPHVAERFGPGDGYDVIALNLVHGNGYVLDGQPAAAERLPLYPLLLALSFEVFGSVSWPWQLAQCLCGAVTCGIVFDMARRYASRAGALAAAGFCAVHPTLTLYAARPLTETLYVFLLVLLVRELSSPTWRAWCVGILLGQQLLLKSTAWLHTAALVPAAVYRRPAVLMHTGAVVLAVLSPWLMWNLWTDRTPHLLAARGGITLFHGIYISRHVTWTQPTADLNRFAELDLWNELARHGIAPTADVVQRDDVAAQVAREWITSHPGEALRLWLRNLVLTWYLTREPLSMLLHFVLHGALLLAAGVGAFHLWRQRPETRPVVSICLLLILAYTAFHAAVHPAVRYILPVVPLAALLAAGAVWRGVANGDSMGPLWARSVAQKRSE